jgi:hypothetical protein
MYEDLRSVSHAVSVCITHCIRGEAVMRSFRRLDLTRSQMNARLACDGININDNKVIIPQQAYTADATNDGANLPHAY